MGSLGRKRKTLGMHKCTTRAMRPGRASIVVAHFEPEKTFRQHTRVPSMNSFATRFSSSSPSGVSLTSSRDNESIDPVLWGSTAGFGSLGKVGVPAFDIPAIPNVRTFQSPSPHVSLSHYDVLSSKQPTQFLQLHTDDHADPSCRIKIQHGTTTLAFRFRGGIIVAVDSRATAGSYIGPRLCSPCNR
jgi:hypothetical protein